jgi:hypothetical protein
MARGARIASRVVPGLPIAEENEEMTGAWIAYETWMASPAPVLPSSMLGNWVTGFLGDWVAY